MSGSGRSADAGEDVLQAVRDGALLAGGERVVVMLSGGRDSVCLLDVAVRLRPGEVEAVHVNYHLRADSDADEGHCAALCERLGVAFHRIDARRDPGEGNLQAWAREIRYAAAIDLAEDLDGLVAAGHTATDQVETILYRLAASPGRRALLGMPQSEGRLVRPLLGVSREQTGSYCRARGLGWRDDETNLSQRYARNRIRSRMLPALREVHPAAEANVLRTAELLRRETEMLDDLVEERLAGASSIPLAELGSAPSALARLIVVRLAEQAAGELVPQAGDRVAELLALGARPGRLELHVGGGVGAVVQGGRLSMVKLPPREPRPRSLGG